MCTYMCIDMCTDIVYRHASRDKSALPAARCDEWAMSAVCIDMWLVHTNVHVMSMLQVYYHDHHRWEPYAGVGRALKSLIHEHVGACRRQMPTIGPAPEGSIGTRRVVLCLLIGAGPRQSPSASSNMSLKTISDMSVKTISALILAVPCRTHPLDR